MSKRTSVVARKHDTSASTLAILEPGQDRRGEEGYLDCLLRQASAAQRLRMERTIADVGVTLPQFLMPMMLRAYPGISSADLARLAMLTSRTVSVTITDLERSGAVTRRPHTVHGRIQRTDITPNGSVLLAACRERSGSIERNLLEGFSSKEEEVVQCWLVHVAKLGSGKPTPQSAHRFSFAAVSDVLNFRVVATIIRYISRYI